MKFIEVDTLKGLSEHLFGASGAMYSIATHLMTLETLFSHPAEFAKRHHESPEVQIFKQNPSRESMVAYTASQTLSHSEIVPEEKQGASIWDVLTQRSSTREAQQTGTFWNAVQENIDDDEPEYDYEDDEQEETIAAPTRRGPRRNVLDDEDEEYDEEQEPFNTPKSSAEHALFIRSWALPWARNALPEPKRQDPSVPEETKFKHESLGQLRAQYWPTRHFTPECSTPREEKSIHWSCPRKGHTWETRTAHSKAHLLWVEPSEQWTLELASDLSNF